AHVRKPAESAPGLPEDAVGIRDSRMGLISQLIDSDMPGRLAQEAREALLCLNEQALQTLSKGRVRFLAGPPHSQKGGDYNPWTRKIQLTRPSKAEDLQHLQ